MFQKDMILPMNGISYIIICVTAKNICQPIRTFLCQDYERAFADISAVGWWSKVTGRRSKPWQVALKEHVRTDLISIQLHDWCGSIKKVTFSWKEPETKLLDTTPDPHHIPNIAGLSLPQDIRQEVRPPHRPLPALLTRGLCRGQDMLDARLV